MGMLKNARMVRAAHNLSGEVERIWNSPQAYRPAGFELPGEGIPAFEALNALADGASGTGVTSGDVSVLAVHLLQGIDGARSADVGFNRTFDAVKTGELRTVSNLPIGKFMTTKTLVSLLTWIARAARPEAFREYQQQEQDAN